MEDMVECSLTELEVKILATLQSHGLDDIIKTFLDNNDPKSCHILIKRGFDKKITAMKRAHQDLVKVTNARTDIDNEEKWNIISNSDGKIRSLTWFRDTIAGV